MKLKKIGVYIDAFDPIHSGNINFAERALNLLNLDVLYFLVEPTPRYKQGVKALDHRINMTILAIADIPKFGTIVPKKHAIIADYISIIQSRFSDNELCIIIPDSSLKQFFRLPNLLNLDLKKTEIVVGLNNQTEDEVNLRLSLLRDTSGLKFKYSSFKAKLPNIRTADLKKQILKGNKPIEMQKKVYDYIIKQGLYVATSKA